MRIRTCTRPFAPSGVFQLEPALAVLPSQDSGERTSRSLGGAECMALTRFETDAVRNRLADRDAKITSDAEKSDGAIWRRWKSKMRMSEEACQ